MAPHAARARDAHDASRRTRRATPAVALLALLALGWGCAPVHAALDIGGVSGSTAYTEAGGAVAVASSMTVSPGPGQGSLTCTSATVKVILAQNVAAQQDALDVASSSLSGLTKSWDGSTKTLTLSGSAAGSVYQSVLRAVTFENSDDNPSDSTRTVRFEVFESGTGLSATAQKYVTVAATNDNPVATFVSPLTAFTENQGPTTVDGALTVTDADGTTTTSVVKSASMVISSGCDVNHDYLAFTTDPISISGAFTSSWTASTCTLALAGDNTLSNYQTLLRSVKFNNTAYGPSGAQRTITLTVTDGGDLSGTATTSFSFTPVNQKPIVDLLVTSAYSYTEGDVTNPQMLTLAPNTKIEDYDHLQLTTGYVQFTSGYENGKDHIVYANGNGITGSWDASTGKMTLTGTATKAAWQAALRTVQYKNTDEDTTPGDKVIAFVVSDGTTESDSKSLTVTFIAVNDAPVITMTTTPINYASNGITQLYPDIAFTDLDNNRLKKATVVIATGYENGDTLATGTLPTGISASYNAGTLTLTGSATKADYQTAMKTVSFSTNTATRTTFKHKITVTVLDNDDLTSATLERLYYANDMAGKPTITSVTVPTTGGERITINGNNFGPINPTMLTSVSIGATACTNFAVTTDYTVMECDAAPGVGGNIELIVYTQYVASDAYSTFKYQDPVVTSVSGVSTTGGEVTITGTNFGFVGTQYLSAAANSQQYGVTIGGSPCNTPTVSTPASTGAGTEIKCQLGEGVGSDLFVTVRVSGLHSGSSGSGKFDYDPPAIPTLQRGSVFGYKVNFTGTSFGPAGTMDGSIKIKENGNSGASEITCASPVVKESGVRVECTLPAKGGSLAITQKYDVIIQVGNQTQTIANKFEYEGPCVTSMTSPSFYGDTVTIYGRNFGPVGNSNAPQVIFTNSATSTAFTATSSSINTLGQAKTPPRIYQTPTVTVENWEMVVYAPVWTNANVNTMTPTVTVSTSSFTGTGATMNYEGPVITEVGTGSQFGDCVFSSSVNTVCSETITVKGRNFGPTNTTEFATWAAANNNGGLSVSTIGAGYAGIKINGELPCADEGCTSRSNSGGSVNTQVIIVTSPTQLTFTRTSARASAPISTLQNNITFVTFCSGSTLATCVDSTGGNGLFNFTGPTVTGISTYASTAGGSMVITGTGFGPLSSGKNFFDTGSFSSSGVKVCSNVLCTSMFDCTSPSVTTTDTAVTCTIPAATTSTGIIINTNMFVYAGNRNSTGGSGTFKYKVPTPTGTQTVVAVGGTLTINGDSFGPAGYQSTANVTVAAGTVACTGVTVVSHTQLTCTQQPGTGAGLDLVITVTSLDGQTSATPAGNGAFSYSPPTVTSVGEAQTAVGSVVTIAGTNFGPARSFESTDSVTIDGVTMQNGAVQSDTQLTVEISSDGPYSAASTAVVVTINGQADSSSATFQFEPPTITSTSTRPSFVGSSTVIFSGTSFGSVGTTPTVAITENGAAPTGLTAATPSLTSCSTTTAHTAITCTFDCATPCNKLATGTTQLALHDVAVTVQGRSKTSTGVLKYKGPLITQVEGVTTGVPGSLDFFASTFDVLKVTGENFGTGSDGTTIDFVGVCPLATTALCSPTAFVTSNSNYAGGVGTNIVLQTPGTEIRAQLPKNYGANFTVLVMVSGVTSDDDTFNATSGYIGNAALSFLGPTITSITSGTLRSNDTNIPLVLAGSRLGPIGTTYLTEVRWKYWGENIFKIWPGANANVTTVGTQLQFYVPAGVGTTQFTVYVDNFPNDNSKGLYVSDAFTFTYVAPAIESVTRVGAMGGTITIHGSSFGPIGTAVASVLINNSTGTQATCTSPSVTVAHSQIECTMPAGQGKGLEVKLNIGAQDSTGGAGKFSYEEPSITSIANMDTNQATTILAIHNTTYPSLYPTHQTGPWMIITGNNFGPIGQPIASVQVAKNYDTTANTTRVNCLYPLVTTANTEIRCLLTKEGFGTGSGSGKEYDVVITYACGETACPTSGVSGSNTHLKKFSYNAPTLVGASITSFFGGQTTTITGTNFGCTSADYLAGNCVLPVGNDQNVTVTIDSKPCTNVAVNVSHTAIHCTAPDMSDKLSITDKPLVLTVQEQQVTGTYTYEGPKITWIGEANIFGGPVVVYGRNFGPVSDCVNSPPCNVQSIKFRGAFMDLQAAKANVTVADEQLVFVVPAGEGIQKDVEIVLGGCSNGNCGQSTGTTGHGLFNYTGPRIESIVGCDTTGGTVTIKGRHFGPVGGGAVQVKINDLDCTSASVTVENKEVECQYIAGTGKGYDVDLIINSYLDGGSGKGMYAYAPPNVNTTSPNNGADGTEITLTGNSFGPQSIFDQGLVNVTVAGELCTELSMVTPQNVLKCKTPFAVGGPVDVIITVNGVSSAVPGIYYYPAPTVTAVSNVPAAGGTLTITGTGFGKIFQPVQGTQLNSAGESYSTQVTEVKVGQATCTAPKVTVKATKLECQLPKALADIYNGQFNVSDLDGDGIMDVLVKIANQNSSNTGNGLFAFDEPTMTSLSANAGAKGTTISLQGTNLGDEYRAVTVTIRGVNAESIQVSTAQTQIRFTIPTGTGTTNAMTFQVNGRNVNTGSVSTNFAYDPPIVDPTQTVGVDTMGGVATFVGSGFGPVGTSRVGTITFPGISTNCANGNVTVDDTTIQCTVSQEGNGKNHTGTLTIDGQTVTVPGMFFYNIPVLYTVSPRNVSEDTNITVTGKNFGPRLTDIKMKVKGTADPPGGGIECKSVAWVNATARDSLRCVSPNSVGRGLNVIVIVAEQPNAETTDVNKLVNFPPPVVLHSSANQVGSKTAGGQVSGPVLITGRNFGPAGEQYKQYFDSVYIGAGLCTEPVVTITGTQLQCLPPEGSGKNLDISVTLGGATGTATNAFSYAEPIIESIDLLPTSGGTVTVRGVNFGPAGGEATTPISAEVRTNETCINPTDISKQNGFLGSGGCTPVKLFGDATEAKVVSHNEMTFKFGLGTGKGYDVLVGINGQDSGISGDNKFAYKPPAVTSVSPTVLPAGKSVDQMTVTIVGENFGVDPGMVDVTVGGKYSPKSSISLLATYQSGGTLSPESKLFFTPPFGAGDYMSVLVHVNGQSSNASAAARWSYYAPEVFNSTPAPTKGGNYTYITGRNFGVVGPIYQVIIDGKQCAQPYVTKPDVEIRCKVAEGIGKGLNIFVAITSDVTDKTTASSSSGIGKYSYMAPTITSILPTLVRAGDMVTIIGDNLGNDPARFKLCVVPKDKGAPSNCYYSQNATMDIAHTRFRVPVPPGVGKDLDVKLVVADVMGPTTPGVKISYVGPAVYSAVGTSTAGGQIRVVGKEFGALNSTFIDVVEVETWGGKKVNCTKPKVVVADTQLECTLPAGTGQKLPVRVSVGGQFSTWESVYSYIRPTITSVEPPSASYGDIVSIIGTSLGDDASLVRLKIGDISVAPIGNDTIEYVQSNLVPNTTNVTYEVNTPHVALRFPVPMGTGKELVVELTTPVVDSLANSTFYAQTSLSAKPAAGKSTTFSFNPPEVVFIQPPPTKGGLAVIIGNNFGPAGKAFLDKVELNSAPCTNASVTVPNTQIQCQAVAGTGLGLPVEVVVTGQSSVGQTATTLSYAIPEVSSLSRSKAKPSTTIALYGSNFGPSADLVKVMLGHVECTAVEMITPHEELECLVGDGEGWNYTVVVIVDSVQSDSDVTFTYYKEGCAEPTAENYDYNATDDDGSCYIIGCLDPTADNYNPIATDDTDPTSCLAPPVQVVMSVDLDYNEYLSDSEYWDSAFLNDLESNTGVVQDRVTITDTYAGSTFFVFLIRDDPDYPASAVASMIEEQILANNWTSSDPALTVKSLEVEGSDSGKIRTKANEPNVSQNSIIGLSCGLAATVLWFLCWKFCLKKFATKCCNPKKKGDDGGLKQVTVFSNPAKQANPMDKPVQLPGGYQKLDA